jgi:hypothetical protein
MPLGLPDAFQGSKFRQTTLHHLTAQAQPALTGLKVVRVREYKKRYVKLMQNSKTK